MSLLPLVGHEEARRVLVRARARDAVPSALLLHGPPGVGKQRLGLWLGQLLLCSSPEDGPCGRCRECRLAVRLEHPDLHWFFPLPRPKGRSARALEDALEEDRGEAIARIRSAPLQAEWGGDPRGFYLPMVRRIRTLAFRGPSEGGRQVILIGKAEELVAQESSREAANALLKVLEEPPEATWLVLTSSRPGRILETIRSRTVPFHVAPIRPEEAEAFLVEHRGVDEALARKAACLAPGSIGRALGYLPEGEEDGPLERIRRQAFRLVRGAVRSRGERFLLALEFPPTGARGLGELLDSVEAWLRDLAAVAAGSEEGTLRNPDAREALEGLVRERGIPADACARAVRHVEEARELAATNLNPQLMVAGLLSGIGRDLSPKRVPRAG